MLLGGHQALRRPWLGLVICCGMLAALPSLAVPLLSRPQAAAACPDLHVPTRHRHKAQGTDPRPPLSTQGLWQAAQPGAA